MFKKTISLILMIGGAVLLILSLAADSVGIGSYPGFHGAQIAGAVIGLVVLVFGYFFGRAVVKK
jgi:Mg2+/Co2+ transporter CorB